MNTLENIDNPISFQLAAEDAFQADLKFIKEVIQKNHPGVYNPSDPHFNQVLSKSYDVAMKALQQSQTDLDKMAVIKGFGMAFKDPHLWVYYDKLQATTKAIIPENDVLDFEVQRLNAFTWIRIPTFAPNKNQLSKLNKIIDFLPCLESDVIVFDLRGNHGGNTAFGEQLLEALFGTESARYQIAKAFQDFCIDCRVSFGNVQHLKNLVSRFKTQFSPSDPLFEIYKEHIENMQKALDQNEKYYTYPVFKPIANPNQPSAFKGKVIAIIDRSCSSATLDFLDKLQVLEPDAIFIGETTGVDTQYGDVITLELPSKEGSLNFPFKIFRNRPHRKDNMPYQPNIPYLGDLNETANLQKFVEKVVQKDAFEVSNLALLSHD